MSCIPCRSSGPVKFGSQSVVECAIPRHSDDGRFRCRGLLAIISLTYAKDSLGDSSLTIAQAETMLSEDFSRKQEYPSRRDYAVSWWPHW